MSRFVMAAALVVGLSELRTIQSNNYRDKSEEILSQKYDNGESEPRGQFSNLMTAIARNDLGSIQTLRDTLQHEARQEQRNFEEIREELHSNWKHGQKNIRSHHENTRIFKRETIENATKNETIGAESQEVQNRTKGFKRDKTIGRSGRASELATEYLQDVGDEPKIKWKIVNDAEPENGDSQICSGSLENKTLCRICAEAINKSLSSNGKLRLQEATFLQGTLIFPGTSFMQKFIDVVLCMYYPIIGVGRFFITSGGKAKSAYFIGNAGVQRQERTVRPTLIDRQRLEDEFLQSGYGSENNKIWMTMCSLWNSDRRAAMCERATNDSEQFQKGTKKVWPTLELKVVKFKAQEPKHSPVNATVVKCPNGKYIYESSTRSDCYLLMADDESSIFIEKEICDIGIM